MGDWKGSAPLVKFFFLVLFCVNNPASNYGGRLPKGHESVIRALKNVHVQNHTYEYTHSSVVKL